MLELHVYKADLLFIKPISISRKMNTVQEAVFVELRSGGVSGWGEASIFPTYDATFDGICSALKELAGRLKGRAVCHPFEFYDSVAPLMNRQSFALCAVDVAMHDLWAKLQGRSISEVIGAGSYRGVRTSMSIMFSSAEEMVRDLAFAKGFSHLKIKIGQADDLEILSHVRSQTAQPIIADANGNLTVGRALELLPHLRSLGVTALEQPISRNAWDEQKTLLSESCIPLIADESFARAEDLEKCMDHFDGVCIKLLKSGGITPSLKIIQELRRTGKRAHMGCMPESMIGIAALSQIGSLADVVDADSVLFFKSLPGSGVEYESVLSDGQSGAGEYGEKRAISLANIGHGATFEPEKGVKLW